MALEYYRVIEHCHTRKRPPIVYRNSLSEERDLEQEHSFRIQTP